MENTDKLVISIEQAGKILGLSRPTAYKLAKSGSIPTLSLGRKIVVSKIQLEKLLAGEYSGIRKFPGK
jgi:excisionase family DNA binding protein